VSLGNDVVDLDDPEARLDGRHPRFDERVFTPRERAALAASPQRQRLHWALWAAKESAYKARKRLAPETFFAPGAYEVELSPLPAAGEAGVVSGHARRHGEAFALEVHVDGAFVHAVAQAGREAAAPVLRRVAPAVGDAGLSARNVAAAAIGSALGLDAAKLRIAGRPPVLLHRGRVLEATLSLSHHGRFVAFACSARRATSGARETIPS
jgi:phosphopantetheine--protein transferase-like protein